MKRTLTLERGHSSYTMRKRMTNSPGESVIRNLLNYSKALAVVRTEETGIINLVMN